MEDPLVVDALNRRLKLRADLATVRLVERGEAVYVYKVVENRKYYRVNEVQHQVLRLMNGTRTDEQIIESFNAGNPGTRIDRDYIEEFVDGLRQTEIFEKSRGEIQRLLLEKLRDQRRRRAENRNPLGNLFEISLPAWDPDRFFERLVSRVRFFWTRSFVILSAACMLGMLIVWAAEWDRIKRGTLALFTFEGMSGGDIFKLLLIALIMGFIHESAHGLTCKHFGGSVRQMGLLFIYFTPCFYVDVSDAYLFDSHAKRQWVIYAGGYIEVFISSLATFVWMLTSPGTAVNDTAFMILILTGLSSIAINYNPLTKLDGYYSLMDFVEIPDLWERSFAYVSGWFKKTLFRLPVELETPTRKVRRILVGYGLASLAYKALLIVVILTFLKNTCLSLFGESGYLAVALVLALALRKPLSSLAGFLRFNFLDKKEVIMKPRSLVLAGTAAVPLLAAFILLPLPIVIRGDCVLEPRSRAFASSSAEGVIDRVLVGEGQEVARGETVAVLRNDAQTRRLRIARGRLMLAEQEVAQAAGRPDRGAMAKKIMERDLLREEVRSLEKKEDALTLRSPIAGVITTPRMGDLTGAYLRPGQPFCEIAGNEGLSARVPVRERRVDEIRAGQRVSIKVMSEPFRTFRGEVVAVSPASSRRETAGAADRDYIDFDVIVSVAGQAPQLRDGMTGTARIEIGRSTPARRLARTLLRWIGARLW